MKHFIYYLPDHRYKDGRIGKVGCTLHLRGRVKDLGARTAYILEEVNGNKFLASRREQYWQRRLGVRKDRNPYPNNWSKYQTHKGCVANGLAAAAINRKNGAGAYFDKRIQSANGKKGGPIGGRTRAAQMTFAERSAAGKQGSSVTNSKVYRCTKCGLHGKGNSMLRWHFRNCRRVRKS